MNLKTLITTGDESRFHLSIFYCQNFENMETMVRHMVIAKVCRISRVKIFFSPLFLPPTAYQLKVYWSNRCLDLQLVPVMLGRFGATTSKEEFSGKRYKSMSLFKSCIKLMRPAQWIKNGFVFMPLVFSARLFILDDVIRALGMFTGFCLAASATYILNDYMDMEQDRIHPRKKNRPLASGEIIPSTALAIAVALVVSLFAGAFAVQAPRLGIICLAAYLVLQIAYSIKLKHVVILDVLTISGGFLLRVLAGAAAIGVAVSSWLILCTFSLAIFLALGKRRHEVLILTLEAANHRPVLDNYNVLLLDQLLQVVTTSSFIFYCLYCVRGNPDTGLHSESLMFTVPFVTYGIFRYMYLIYYREEGGSPTALLLTDPPLLICTMMWLAAFISIIYL